MLLLYIINISIIKIISKVISVINNINM